MKYDLGYLGGGQIARMSVQAAQRMGLRCLVLDPDPACCASQVADAISGPLDDSESIARVVASCERLTLENEFIPAGAIREAFEIAGRDPERLTPGIETLKTIQDKLLQREAMNKAGVPCPNAAPLIDPDGLIHRVVEQPEEKWRPIVMKSRFGGYDGKGTRYGRTREEFVANLPANGSTLTPQPPLPRGEGEWLIEEFVPFRRELALMVFVQGDQVGAYPTMETVQTNHVCDLVYPSDEGEFGPAEGAAVAIAAVEAVGGQGLFGVELFELEGGEIWVNEIAPRPHNTGHYTLDWGGTSQFEQHVRLAMGWPVDPAPKGWATCMANLLGPEAASEFDLAAATEQALRIPGAHVHWYGKSIRSGRKVGHIDVVGVPCLVETAKSARAAFFGGR